MLHRLLLTLLLCGITTTIFFVPKVMAADGQLSGKVVDSSGAPVTGSKLVVVNAATGKEIGNFPTDISGNYRLQIPQGVYNITLIPAATSGFPPTTLSHVPVSGNTVKDISLSATPKVPASKKSTNNLVPTLVIGEIIAVILVILGYTLWKRKHH